MFCSKLLSLDPVWYNYYTTYKPSVPNCLDCTVYNDCAVNVFNPGYQYRHRRSVGCARWRQIEESGFYLNYRLASQFKVRKVALVDFGHESNQIVINVAFKRYQVKVCHSPVTTNVGTVIIADPKYRDKCNLDKSRGFFKFIFMIISFQWSPPSFSRVIVVYVCASFQS